MRRREFLGAVGAGIGLGAVPAGPWPGRPADRPGTGRVDDHRWDDETSVSPAGAAEPYAPLGFVSVRGAKEAVVGADGRIVYLAATSGFAVVDCADPADPQVIAERRDLLSDRENGPLRAVWDVTVDGDRLLVVGPAHGGGDDRLSGALVYDVSDPADPERLAFYETAFPIHNAFLADGVAFLTGNDRGDNPLVTVDVSGTPAELGRWSPVDRDERWGEVPQALRPLHDVWVNEGTAALSYWDAGTWLVDVTDPAAPRFEGRAGGRPRSDLVSVDADAVGREATTLPGNHHNATTSDDGGLLAIGKEAWAAADGSAPGPGGVSLWDVSGDRPVRRAEIPPPPSPDPTRSGVWTTAHNFDLAGERLYTSWYRGGVKIHDVSDPAAPRELAWWREPDRASFWAARRGDGFVAASSWGTPDGPAGLYTFPDRAGTQADPPSLTPSPTPTPGSEGSGSTSGATGTPPAGATITAGTADPSPAETTEPAGKGGPHTHSHSHSHTHSDGGADTGDPNAMPGFTVGGALAGIALALRLLRNR